MEWFLHLELSNQISIVAVVVALIGVFIALLQLVKSNKNESTVKQSVEGNNNKTIQIAGDNHGDNHLK